jgi:aspartate aminotransferase
MQLADRMRRIAPSPTLRVAQEADRLKRQGIDVVDLGAGEPDFATPEPVKAAAHAAIDANFTKYTPASGIPELKQAICARYHEDYGVSYTEPEVIVTAGGKQALFNVAFALFNPGNEVITHGPYWPSIVDQIRLADARAVIVRTHSEDGFEIHAERIIDAITPRTRAIILNSPCNPTGALISEQAVADIADAAAKRGIWIVIDLCYERLIYDDVPHNLIRVLSERVRDRAVVCGSASKAYAMTGWRCGWALGPTPLIAACNALQGHSTSNVTSITQKAALGALVGSQAPVAAMLDEYRRRRDSLFTWLAEDTRFECLKPKGAFYMFPRIIELLSAAGIRTSAEYADRLLAEARVAVTAGEGFDAPGYLRLSYATSLERLREGVTRMLEFARSLEGARPANLTT